MAEPAQHTRSIFLVLLCLAQAFAAICVCEILCLHKMGSISILFMMSNEIKSWQEQKSEPGDSNPPRPGEQRECYLCAMPPPLHLSSLRGGSSLRTRFQISFVPGGKFHSSVEATETCKFWTDGVVSSGVAGFGLVRNNYYPSFKSLFLMNCENPQIKFFTRVGTHFNHSTIRTRAEET